MHSLMEDDVLSLRTSMSKSKGKVKNGVTTRYKEKISKEKLIDKNEFPMRLENDVVLAINSHVSLIDESKMKFKKNKEKEKLKSTYKDSVKITRKSELPKNGNWEQVQKKVYSSSNPLDVVNVLAELLNEEAVNVNSITISNSNNEKILFQSNAKIITEPLLIRNYYIEPTEDINYETGEIGYIITFEKFNATKE